GPAAAGLLGQGGHDQVTGLGGDVGGQRRRLLLDVLEGDAQRRGGLERPLAGQALVGDHAQRVQVGGGGGGFAEDQLRGQVGGGPHDGVGVGELAAGRGTGDAEVGQHQPAVGTHQQVARFDV